MIKKNNSNLKDEKAKKRLNELAKIIYKHNIFYHEKNNPEITDVEFDKLIKENDQLERNFPHLVSNKSPNKFIGSKVGNKFKKYEHKERMLSLSNAFNKNDLVDFVDRIKKFFSKKQQN